jgi:4,5-DOPA dioxygenase extradiol
MGVDADMTDTMPVLFLSHGAPTLVDDQLWVSQLAQWAAELPKPQAILIISAHWELAPPTIGSTHSATPLTYDFFRFAPRYYHVTYWSPGAPALANRIKALMPDGEPVADDDGRRLDHGAYVPLTVMYPEADIPVLQISMPNLDPESLLGLGQRLRPLRDEGVLIIGSGFATHGLRYLKLKQRRSDAKAPGWSTEFDTWLAERFTAGDIDALIHFRAQAPGMPYAHPTIEHFAPLFVALGASSDPEQVPRQVIDGYWFGLSKRSIQLG